LEKREKSRENCGQTQNKALSQGNRVLFTLGRKECSEISPGLTPMRESSDLIIVP
jgi:hypothetical protein